MKQQPAYEDFFAEIRDAELRATPHRHPDWTPSCPPLTAFPEAAASGRWKESSAQDHTAGCPYCRKMLALQWELEPPSLLTLARFAAGQLPDHAALTLFLASGSDEAEKSSLLLRSKRVAFLKDNLQAAASLQEQFALFAPLSYVWQQKSAEAPPIHVRAQGEHLTATLYEDGGRLLVRLKNTANGPQPMRVRVELLRTGTDDRIVIERELSADGVEDVELLSLSTLHERPARYEKAFGGCVVLAEVLPRNG